MPFRRSLARILLATICGGCAAAPHEGYPARWWQPALATTAPAWEILPQAAAAGEVILSKRNDLGILSNFAATPFAYHGIRYASVEGFWQMMKFPESPEDPRNAPGIKWPSARSQVAEMTAFEAKHAGDIGEANMKNLVIEYVTFEGEQFPYRQRTHGRHYQLILDAMRAKLAQNPQVRETLLATGTLILKPDHHQGLDDPDEWRYFEIWMQLRAELQRQTR